MNKKYLIIVLALFFYRTNYAQPQWKFYVAFEDAASQKDTIWLIYDTTAHVTSPVDSALGESGSVFNYSEFNVWTYNADNDSTKTAALPYTLFPYLTVEVRAFNYQYPIVIRWDTSLFHASYLPFNQGEINAAAIYNDYFWQVNNDWLLEAFNMLIDDSCVAPSFTWGPQDHFPMVISFGYDPSPSVREFSYFNGIRLLYKSNSEFIIDSEIQLNKILVLDTKGNSIHVPYLRIDTNRFILNIENIESGMYILNILTNTKKNIYEKFIKID